MLWQMDVLQKSYSANTEEVCRADFLEHPQQTFLKYRLSCFLMEYKENMAFYHHYFNNAGSVACTETGDRIQIHE